jgi:hypothetical protein
MIKASAVLGIFLGGAIARRTQLPLHHVAERRSVSSGIFVGLPLVGRPRSSDQRRPYIVP